MHNYSLNIGDSIYSQGDLNLTCEKSVLPGEGIVSWPFPSQCALHIQDFVHMVDIMCNNKLL